MSSNQPRTAFSGESLDFAVGSVKGLRSWNMDKFGRLHGVTHREVWRPGVNVSKCFKTIEVPCPALVKPEEPKALADAAVETRKKPTKWRRSGATVTFHTASPSFADVQWQDSDAPRCDELTCRYGVHQVPTKHSFDTACECGFWAYDEGGFTDHGKVIGLIEGFGRTTIGTKGFRSEKARIVAFVRYFSETQELTASEEMRLTELYPDAEWFDDVNDLVKANPEVLREWPEVGEGFWDEPVPANPMFGGYSNIWSTYVGLRTSSPWTSRLFGGGAA